MIANRARYRLAAVGAALLSAGSVGAAAAAGTSPSGTDPQPAADLAGTTVTVLGAFIDADAEAFESSVAAFEEETGIDIEYTGTGDFTALIGTQVEAGTPPDIAFFPTPGQITDFASRGEIQPVSDAVAALAEENYIESWYSLGSYEGELYGIAYKASVKSMVWYSPAAFEAGGYAVPETWDELVTLTDAMVADGHTPWCVGFENAEASGWPGTDWIEDIVLRAQGAEYYDQWVNHEVPFDDQGVKDAFATFGSLVLAEGHAYGGSDAIVTTGFGDAMAPMFAEDGPGCLMHRQASFFTSFLPEGTTVGPDGDVNVFILPSMDDGPAPIVGGGDFAVSFSDRPEVDAVMQFLATPAAGEGWAANGGYVAPYRTFDTSLYPEGIDQVAGAAIAEAEVFRFDGSDAMPGPVQPEFWAAMINFATGSSVDEVTGAVESAFE